MLQWIMERGIRGMEKQLGVELNHLRTMARVSPGLLGRVALFMPLLAYRRRVPSDLQHMAGIGATMAQDCGECLQIAVNVAVAQGLSPKLVEAAVRGRTDDLTELQALALRFGERASTGVDTEEERAELEAHLGEAGVVELASSVAASQYYPVLKRGMGLAHACRIDGIRYHAA
jgi:alkylhydroperoxidase/carboxymuconolactone decarboxylase family protein YurZ